MIREIRDFIHEKKRMENSFLSNAKLMCPGTYTFDRSVKFMMRNDQWTENTINEMIKQDKYSKAYIRFFIVLLKMFVFRKKLVVPKQQSVIEDFSGTVYLPVRSTNSYNDTKIFDLTRNKILSIFTRNEDYQSVLTNLNYFNEYFPIPQIIWKSDQKLFIMEELIRFKSLDQWTNHDYEFVIKGVFGHYIEYFKACKQNGQFSLQKRAIICKESLGDTDAFSFDIDEEIAQQEFPYVLLHGDLWTGNLLLEEQVHRSIYYIDWEYSSELLFFYDLLNMMWIEIYMNNNYVYFDQYLNGDYDEQFSELFLIFNLRFYTERRLDYFMLYFVHFLHVRGSHFDRKDKLIYLEKYKKLLKRVNGKLADET
ncbi:phosphotransferase [Bacillus rubiinfantis]|uniref:phosphotransferase n=1 Tax=Bacillus rubiinfantis TaxID=1499680 RepID=UPI0005AB3141|nr:phosphotransferase [Bacillus rubiinfantis]